MAKYKLSSFLAEAPIKTDIGTVDTDFYILQNNNKYNISNIECYDKKNKLLVEDDLKIKINFMPNIFNKIIQDILIKINILQL